MGCHKITFKTIIDGEVVSKRSVLTSSVCWDSLIIDFCNILNTMPEGHQFYIPIDDIEDAVGGVVKNKFERGLSNPSPVANELQFLRGLYNHLTQSSLGETMVKGYKGVYKDEGNIVPEGY